MSKEIELLALAHTLKSLNQGPTNKEREEVFHKIATLNRCIYEVLIETEYTFQKVLFRNLKRL